MVFVNTNDIINNLTRWESCRRMPVLCSLSRSLGWRLLTETCEDRLKGLKTHYFDVTAASGNGENYLTSIAVSEETGIVAISSGSNEGILYFVKDTFTTPCLMPNCRFRPIYKEILGSPIYSLDWSGNHLLVGINNGTTRIYKVHFSENNNDDEYTFEQLSLIGEYTDPIHETDIYSSCYTTNFHVKSVEFSPDYSFNFVGTNKGSSRAETPSVPSRFLSLTANKISVWDALQEKAPLSSIKASDNPLNCASWSPNQPHSLIVCGGVDKELKIIDSRTAIGDDKGIVWKAKNAHDRPIRDARFNPYIPYWLASAGEDAIVNIWDIRSTYHAPVAKIDGHSSIITSVLWSSIRPENILTASFDGTMRFWELSPETYPIWDTHYRLGNYGNNDSLPLIYGLTFRKISTNKGWSRQSNGYMYADGMKSWLSDEDSMKGQPKTTMMLAGALGIGEWGRREPGPIYKGEPIVEARGAVVSIKASKSFPSIYYCITNGGQLTSQTVRYDVATNIKCHYHQYNLKDKNDFAREIEDDIYCRKVPEAKSKLEVLKEYSYGNEEEEKQKIKVVEFLENCLEEIPPIKTDSWSIDSIPESLNHEEINSRLTDNDRWEYSINVFKEELKHWNSRLPPGYKYTETVDTDILSVTLDYDNKLDSPLPQFPVSDNSLNSKNTDNSQNEKHPLQIDRKILSLEDEQNTRSSINSTPVNITQLLNNQIHTSVDNNRPKRTTEYVATPDISSSPESIQQSPFITKDPEYSSTKETKSTSLTTVPTKNPTTPVEKNIFRAENHVNVSNSNSMVSPSSMVTGAATGSSKSISSINTNPFITPTSMPTPMQSKNPFESDITGLGIQPIKNNDYQDRQSIKSKQSLESSRSSNSKLQGWLPQGLTRTNSKSTIDGDNHSSKPKKYKLNFFKHLKSRTHNNTITPDAGEKINTTELQNQSIDGREKPNLTL